MFGKNAFKSLVVFTFCLFKIVSAASAQTPKDTAPAPDVFIHTGFENASPLNWEADSAGRIIISLVYDHERFSQNRANNHWHFKVEAPVGKEVTLILQNFDNIWNNIHASPISKQSPIVLSADGKSWESRPTEYIEGKPDADQVENDCREECIYRKY
jgi:hypothetical protein